MGKLFEWLGLRHTEVVYLPDVGQGILPRNVDAVEVVRAFLRETIPPVSDEFCLETAKALLDRLSRNGWSVERREA